LALFLVFLLAYTLSQFFRSFLAVIAPTLSLELGLTASDLANMSAAWFGVFAFAQFPLGVALDRFGPRRTVPALMLPGVLGAILLARAESATGCLYALALIGLGCSPIYMGALYYFGRTETPERFGLLSACLLGFGSAGNLLAATPLALAMQMAGWRGTFVAIAALMLISALLFLVLVADPPPPPKPKVQVSALAAVYQVATLPGLWTLMPLLTLGYATVVVERGLWVGPYMADVHKLGPVPLGNAVLAMAVAMSVGALAYGSLDRAFGRRKIFVALGSCLTAAGFATLAFNHEPALGMAIATIAFIGLAGLCHPLLFTHARMFFPDHLLGRGITFANFLTIGGAGLVHFASGAFVARLQASGLPAPAIYAALHLAFAATILGGVAIYLTSPANPARQKGGRT
jgi:nitrate/nitrite transporter NarK